MAVQISVVVPTYQRPQLLEQCLKSLLAQDLSADAFEIIIADDGPSAATEALVQQYASRSASRPEIRYIAVTGPHGPAAARNRGWRAAGADIIAFTDDDCQPGPRWLSEGLSVVKQGADAAWGKIVMPVPAVPTDYEKDASHLAHAEFVTANCFCRRSALQRVGGFDERFRLAWREDSDLFFNLMNSGAVIRHAPQAIVVHPIRPAPWGVSLSQQRKVVFDALLYKKHPDLYRQKIRATPPWDYYGIVASVLFAVTALFWGHVSAALGALAIWLALTLAFFWRRMRGTSRSPRHVLEMLWTSVLIPPVALFWHWRGVLKFRVLYI